MIQEVVVREEEALAAAELDDLRRRELALFLEVTRGRRAGLHQVFVALDDRLRAVPRGVEDRARAWDKILSAPPFPAEHLVNVGLVALLVDVASFVGEREPADERLGAEHLLEIPRDQVRAAEDEEVAGEVLHTAVYFVPVVPPNPSIRLLGAHTGIDLVDDHLGAILVLLSLVFQGSDPLEESPADVATGDDEAPALIGQRIGEAAAFGEVGGLARVQRRPGRLVGGGRREAAGEDGLVGVGVGEEEVEGHGLSFGREV
jgi:hypothetical protein